MDVIKLMSDAGLFVVIAGISGIVFAGIIVFGKQLVRIADLILLDRKQLEQLVAQTDSPWSQDGALLRMEVDECEWANPWRMRMSLKLTNRSTFHLLVRQVVAIVSLNIDGDDYHPMVHNYLPCKNQILPQQDWRLVAWFDLPPHTSHKLECLRPQLASGWSGPGKAVLGLTLNIKQGRFQENRQIQLQLTAPLSYPQPVELPKATT